jgi:hypothetical protein
VKYCEASNKKCFTVPESVNAQRYRLWLYKDQLFKQSNKLLMNSIKSAVFEAVLFRSCPVCMQVRIVDAIELLSNCVANLTRIFIKEFG